MGSPKRPEFSPDEAREAIGDTELGKVRSIEYVDIDSGHWPMITRPQELAEILAPIVAASASGH